MARRQEELVAAIRAQRRELQAVTRELLALDPIKARIRAHPVPWLLGGVILGGLLLRFAMKPMWRRRGAWAGGWLRSRLRETMLRLVTATMIPRATEPASSAAEATVDARVARTGKVARARARITPVRSGSSQDHSELARRRSMR